MVSRKRNRLLKGVSLGFVFALVVAGTLVTTKISAEKTKDKNERIAVDITSILNTVEDKNTMEYMKRVDGDGNITERWRDCKSGKERVDRMRANGDLINSIIVTNEGSKVIIRANEMGTQKASSWILPEKIANENKRVLSKSFYEEELGNIKNKKWFDDGITIIDNIKVRQFTNSENPTNIIYLYSDTGKLYKSIKLSSRDNPDMIIEEYRVLKKIPSTLFEIKDIEIKQVPPPVAGDSLGQG